MIKSMIRSEITDNRWYDSMLAGNPSIGSYQLIATANGTGVANARTITFSSIPSDYSHLQIRFVAKNITIDTRDLNIRFNTATTSIYSWYTLIGNGSTATGAGNAVTQETVLQNAIARSTVAGLMGFGVIDIADYANPNKNKSVRALHAVVDPTALDFVSITGGNFANNEPISVIELTLNGTSAEAFTTSTRFSLYGIRG